MEFQKDELDEILNIFQQESSEIISSMDSKLLKLEHDGKDDDTAMQLFRDAHSLKGSARMLGFVNIQNVAHKIEDIINLIKEDKIEVTSLVADTISECLDFISELISKTVEAGEEYKSDEIQNYIKRLEDLEKITNSPDSTQWEETNHEQNNEQKNEIEKKENTQADVFEENKALEIIQRLPLMELNCNFYDETNEILDTIVDKENNEDIKKIYKDIKDIIAIFNNNSKPLQHDAALGIKEAIEAVKNDKITPDIFKELDVIKTMVDFQYSPNKKEKAEVKSDLSQKDILNTITNTEIKTLRVDSVKLDNLVGQIRELIISKIKTNEQLSLAKKINNDLVEWQKNFSKMGYYIKYFDKKYLSSSIDGEGWDYRKIIAYNKQLSTLAESHGEKINELIKEMNNLFRQLQESDTKLNTTTNEIDSMVKNMRVLPLSTIFQLFPRMVHNIARDKNKKIDLIIEGSDITADKTIIEEIKIPLMHIIRNSIDHGIESVEERKALDKSPIGKIEIAASHQDNNIIIDVKDDGRGLDIEKIKTKALEKKILTKDELNAISDEELTNLIFYPGFSTEDFVTELSGRGLGLDIVNSKINQMQGRIDIFSEVNKGTVVRIILPATVATKRVFIIEEQNQLFAIETSVIKNILRINSDEIFEKDSKSYFIYNGVVIGVHTLSQILNLDGAFKETNKYTIMIIDTENTTFGIIVEKLISDQEIVHKKLSAPLYKVRNISGITTLANGEACLILNISDIIATINSSKIGLRIKSKDEEIRGKDNSKYKILIVDDSHTTRMLQKNILSNHGYDVYSATNPILALESAAHNKFDLVISDIQMPEMNGFEFISKLRETKDYATCPIMIISSEPREKYEKEINQNNIISYIQKSSFNQEKLISEIEGILNY